MKNFLFLITAFICSFNGSGAEKAEPPDTVYTGIYITSIHDIDFRQKEYSVNLWLWLKYKNRDFDFLQNLEVPQAKTVTKSFSTIDTTGGRIYMLMKLQCVMKDFWQIKRFPFDRQKLRLTIENSQFDSRSLVFREDHGGQHFDPRFTIHGWVIDSFKVSSKARIYETDFGDDELGSPRSEYSAFKVSIGLHREALDLFWKMFLGMYMAFLIAFVSFFIHADSVESRFGLSVGSLFAVVGNKYIIDSALPESSSFTLVDILHGMTLLYIFVVIVCSVYALFLVKRGETEKAKKFDRWASMLLLLTYLTFNSYFIWEATR